MVSGLQPTGALHVGNYFAALRRLVRLQDAGEDVTLFVADLHAITARHVRDTFSFFMTPVDAFEAKRKLSRSAVERLERSARTIALSITV